MPPLRQAELSDTNEWNYRGGITAILRDFSSELPLRWNRVGGITETIFLSAYVIPPRVRLCDSTQILCLSGIIVVESRRFCVILRLNCHCGGIALVESQLGDSTSFLSAYVIPPTVRLCDSTQVLRLSGIIVVELRAKSNFGNKGMLANRTTTDVVRQLNFW
jgi:hypothetical protein